MNHFPRLRALEGWPTRRLAAAAMVVHLVTSLVAAPLLAKAPAGVASIDISRETLDRIQRECLRAYPSDIRAKMASGSESIPTEVESDPREQMQFLNKELEVDKGLFYPSLLEDLLPAFKGYVGEGTRFLDLGSGDGRVVFLANAMGAEATGIEWEDDFVNVSLRAMDALDGVVDPSRVEIIQGDFFDNSWSHYDVIFYFDTSSLEHDRLRQKMMEELPPEGRLIIGHEIVPFPGYELEAEHGGMRIYKKP